MSDNGENGSSDQNNWLRKGWIWALKGWTKFLILALIILFVVLLYQSWSFVNKTTHQLTISPLLKKHLQYYSNEYNFQPLNRMK